MTRAIQKFMEGVWVNRTILLLLDGTKKTSYKIAKDWQIISKEKYDDFDEDVELQKEKSKIPPLYANEINQACSYLHSKRLLTRKEIRLQGTGLLRQKRMSYKYQMNFNQFVKDLFNNSQPRIEIKIPTTAEIKILKDFFTGKVMQFLVKFWVFKNKTFKKRADVNILHLLLSLILILRHYCYADGGQFDLGRIISSSLVITEKERLKKFVEKRQRVNWDKKEIEKWILGLETFGSLIVLNYPLVLRNRADFNETCSDIKTFIDKHMKS